MSVKSLNPTLPSIHSILYFFEIYNNESDVTKLFTINNLFKFENSVSVCLTKVSKIYQRNKVQTSLVF